MILQSLFGRKFISETNDNVFYNVLVFFAASVFFCADIPSASPVTWCFALAFGVLTSVFQISYTSALSSGNVSLTVMMVNLSILFPVVVSLICFGENLTVLRLAGIILTLISFVLCADFKNKEKSSRKWLLLSVTSMLANALLGITQKFFGASAFVSEKKSYIACAYAIAFLITSVIFTVNHLRHKKSTVYSKPQTYIFTAVVGIVLALYQWLNTYALSKIDGSFLYPVQSGLSIVLLTVIGVVLFKDKLTNRQKLSTAVGLIAIVIMNL